MLKQRFILSPLSTKCVHYQLPRRKIEKWRRCLYREPRGGSRDPQTTRLPKRRERRTPSPTPCPPLRTGRLRAAGVEEVAAAPSLHRRVIMMIFCGKGLADIFLLFEAFSHQKMCRVGLTSHPEAFRNPCQRHRRLARQPLRDEDFQRVILALGCSPVSGRTPGERLVWKRS